MDSRPESRQSPWQATPGGVFLSYRRGDSLPTTARLADDLVDYFGRRRVYRDVDSNRAGQDFVEQIHAALQSAQAVVAVIGPEWVSTRDADGVQRLEDPEDPVRIEIVAALEAGVPIIPVLVGGAAMPKALEVPAPVRPLCKIHALPLADDDWRYHLGRLLETLEDHGVVPTAEPTEPAPAAAGELLKPRRFERTVKISRPGAYRAVVRAVHVLQYGVLSEDPEAASITFRPW
jgi:TIR domain